jgi:hypothetical protein
VSVPGSRYRTARALGVAVAGLFAGHWLVYRILTPNALQRALLLAETGHAYLPPAVAAGAGLAAVAAVGTFLLGYRRGGEGGPGRRPARPTMMAALGFPALAQATAFVLLEALERVLAGAPLNGLLGPLLPVGVGVQFAAGALGGLLLFGIDRAGEHAGRRFAGRPPVVRRAPAPLAHRATALLPPTRFAGEAAGIRGPPRRAGVAPTV